MIRTDAKEGELLKDVSSLTKVPLKKGLGFHGEIYFRRSATNPPGWVGFLNSGASAPIQQVFSAQAAALLIVRTEKGRFAISFGHAWQWLRDNVIQRRFGLIAALNCIQDDQIKSVDAQQIDSLALSRRAQASHSSEIVTFGLDIRRDLMKAILGRPKSPEIGKAIMGADALRIVCKIDFENIGEKCDQLFEISKRQDYKENFGWVDNIEIIKNPDEQKRLNDTLIERINSRRIEGIYLAPPRIADLMTDEEYRFHFDEKGADRPTRFDIEFDELMEGIDKNLPIDLSFLKKHKIEVFAGSSTAPIDTFSIYSGIVFETGQGSNLNCLIDGDWYNVSKAHVQYINNRIAKIAMSALNLPDAGKNEKEGDYNIRASQALNASCMDKKLIQYGGGASKVEVCDILTSAPEFVHIKRASSSQVLSHLFNQGVVAGQFLLEEEFRKECVKKADQAYHKFFATPFHPDKATITFGIIAKNSDKLPNELPFFSKQTLINAADLLGKFNYKVALRGVKASI